MTVDDCTKLSEISQNSFKTMGIGKDAKMPQAFVYNFKINENVMVTERYPRKIPDHDRPRNPSFVRSLEFARRKIIESERPETRKEEEECKEDLLSAARLLFDEANLPEEFPEWSYDEQRQWIKEKGSKELLSLPDSLSFLIPSMSRPGDCGRKPTDKPDWLDMEKFRRGQRFGLDYWSAICFGKILSLYLLFSFEDGLKSMILSHQSDTPYLAFKRYLSTVYRVRNWFATDPWTEGTAAYKDIQVVRKMHLAIRLRVRKSKPKEIDVMSKISNPWCPMVGSIKHDFRSGCPVESDRRNPYKLLLNAPWRPKGLNQGEMAGTQFAFMGLVLLYPQAFGIHYATDEDFEGFCHFWKGIGYLLGMEDEYNFCTGTLEEVRQRCKDYIDICVKSNLRNLTPEWEHMTRCAVEGTSYYVFGTSFSVGVMYIADLFEISMPIFSRQVNFFTRLLYMLTKWFFYYVAKIPQVIVWLNNITNKAIDKAVSLSPQEHSTFEEKSTKALLDFSMS